MLNLPWHIDIYSGKTLVATNDSDDLQWVKYLIHAALASALNPVVEYKGRHYFYRNVLKWNAPPMTQNEINKAEAQAWYVEEAALRQAEMNAYNELCCDDPIHLSIGLMGEHTA